MEILKSSIKHTFNEITFSIREGTWNEQSIHLWNWNFKLQLRWWKQSLLNVKQHFKIKIQMAGRHIFLTNFGHHYEFQMKKTKKPSFAFHFCKWKSNSQLQKGNNERWMKVIQFALKNKVFWFFFFGTFCCQFENSFLFELCFFFQPAFNSKWITIQTTKNFTYFNWITFSK